MDKNKQYKIALVIRTNGLEYDDRVRKEVMTIQKLFPNVKFKIFPMLDDNRSEEGICSYGVPYKTVHSPARDKYPQASHLMTKSIDFYKSVRNDLKGFDAVWCGDYHTFMIAALCGNKNLLWDLHEIPEALLGNSFKKLFLKYIFKRCKIVIHANPQRISYLYEQGVIQDKSKHYAIRNYPKFDDIDSIYDHVYQDFIDWKKDRKCVYLQGLGEYGRAPFETISAVLMHKDLVAVVVGDFDNKALKKLRDVWGKDLEGRIFFLGKIPQLKIPQYVAQCMTTLVFYKNVSPNNWYCEANRFYQSVILGLPVIVGNNPTMRDLVEKFDIGISINSDGSDINEIKKGLDNIVKYYHHYCESNLKHRNDFLWDQQESELREITVKLFS